MIIKADVLKFVACYFLGDFENVVFPELRDTSYALEIPSVFSNNQKFSGQIYF